MNISDYKGYIDRKCVGMSVTSITLENLLSSYTEKIF